MQATSLYHGLVISMTLGVLVSLAPWRGVRALRTLTVLATYFMFIRHLRTEPTWEAVIVWCLAGLATGLSCFLIDCVWLHRGRRQQPELDWPTSWWLIPMGMYGWPDMLTQTVEIGMMDWRRFGGRKEVEPTGKLGTGG